VMSSTAPLVFSLTRAPLASFVLTLRGDLSELFCPKVSR